MNCIAETPVDRNFLIQPWQGKCINGIQILVKYLRNNDSYKILVTDLKDIWYEELNITVIEARNKELNSKIEVIPEEITKHLDSIVNKSEIQTEFDLKYIGKEKLCLTCASKLYQLRYSWEFRLQSCSRNKFAEHLTKPLISMLSELQRQQAALCELLLRKDAEIEEYKFAGSKIPKHSQTNPFDENKFLKDSLQPKELSKLSERPEEFVFNDKAQELYSAIMKAKKDVVPKKSIQDKLKAQPVENIQHENVKESLQTPTNCTNETSIKPSVKDLELERRQKLQQMLSQNTSTPEVKRKRKKL